MTDQEHDPLEALIAEAIQRDCLHAHRHARVPPVEMIWANARMRARQDAVRKAMRPLIISQTVGVAAFAALLVSLVSRLSLSVLPQPPVLLVEIVLTSCLVFAPIVCFVAFAHDD